MEEVDILYNLIGSLIDQKMENVEMSISKNQLTFTKNGNEYTLQLTKKY